MWYGRALPGTDGSYIVTEWFTVYGVPLLPLGSKRVIWDEEWYRENNAKPWWNREFSLGQVSHYKVVKVPLYMPHVIKAYLVVVGGALGALLFLYGCSLLAPYWPAQWSR